jgi:hypothetical protein
MRGEAMKCIFFGKPEGKGLLMIPRYRRFEVVLKNLATPLDTVLLDKLKDDQLVKKIAPLVRILKAHYSIHTNPPTAHTSRDCNNLMELKCVKFLALATGYQPLTESAQWSELRRRVQ